MNNALKGTRGESVAISFIERLGYTKVRKSDRNGSDVIGEKSGRKYLFEVKTTTKAYALPDFHSTEFRQRKGGWYFVADFLVVVRLKGYKPCSIHLLSKKDMDRHAAEHCPVMRIRPRGVKTDIEAGVAGKRYDL
jgi:hypothetical protein